VHVETESAQTHNHGALKRGAKPSKEACVPDSTRVPWSRTIILSADTTVDKRWAMMMVDRPLDTDCEWCAHKHAS
jgi:hypothetical protein